MSNIFIACEQNFPRVLNRSRAKGYKRLVILDDVQSFSKFELKTDDTDLVMQVVENDESEPESFTFLCKEFGLDDEKFKSDISVIYLDGGYMLVTLHKGALAFNIEVEDGSYKMMAPSINVDEKLPSFNPSDILWCDVERLMAYNQYLGDFKSNFVYDFEFFFTVAGTQRVSAIFYFKPLKGNDVDISLGYYALYVDEKQKKEEMRQVNKLTKMFNTTDTSTEFEFDESEETDEDGLMFDDDDDY